MTYSVNWKLTAIQQLDRLIAAAADPQSVRQAAAFIDYAAPPVAIDLWPAVEYRSRTREAV